jgi:anaerobic sulfite reductase subunit A
MEHLISWTPLFLVDMKKFAKTDFYQALALMTSGFLAVDRELLEGLLAEELEAVGNEWNKKDNPKSEE